MALGDMEDDRPCLEQGEIALLIRRNLTERMKRKMGGFLHRAKRNKANLVGLPHLLKCPANARIACQPLAAIGRPFKGGDSDGHRELLGKIIGCGTGKLSRQFTGIEDESRPEVTG